MLFFLNLGETDKLKPVDIIGMVNDCTGVRDINIGKIDIMKNFSFFEAEESYTQDILEGLVGSTFKKRKINVEIAEAKKSESKFDSRKGKKKKKYKKDSPDIIFGSQKSKEKRKKNRKNK